MTRLYLVLDAVTLADPRVDTRGLLQEMMWAKQEYDAQVFTVARRRAFELSKQAERDARAAGVQNWEAYASDAFSTGFRPIRELAYDDISWVIALVSDRIFDHGGAVWPTRAWRHAAPGKAPIVLIRNGGLSEDEKRWVEHANAGDKRRFDAIDARMTSLVSALPDILARG